MGFLILFFLSFTDYDLSIERSEFFEFQRESVIADRIINKPLFAPSDPIILSPGAFKVEEGIYINLEKMELELVKRNGILRTSKTYPLLAIRKGFKNFNTPRGDFKALYKTENHLSSYFDVWMPYSIQFHGDYFLHGYPTYNDEERTPVPWGISGGCIRMDTEDMKEIFELVELGMPITIK